MMALAARHAEPLAATAKAHPQRLAPQAIAAHARATNGLHPQAAEPRQGQRRSQIPPIFRTGIEGRQGRHDVQRIAVTARLRPRPLQQGLRVFRGLDHAAPQQQQLRLAGRRQCPRMNPVMQHIACPHLPQLAQATHGKGIRRQLQGGKIGLRLRLQDLRRLGTAPRAARQGAGQSGKVLFQPRQDVMAQKIAFQAGVEIAVVLQPRQAVGLGIGDEIRAPEPQQRPRMPAPGKHRQHRHRRQSSGPGAAQ